MKVVDTNVEKRLLVKRGGEYYADFVGDCKVYRTNGYEGSLAKLTVDCSDLIVLAKEVPSLMQATIKVKMFNKFYGEFANANWALFGKPILAGFEIPEDCDAEMFAQMLGQALSDCINPDNKWMTVKVDGTSVVCELQDDGADFDTFALEVYDPTACDSCLGEYNRVKVSYEISHNVEPFATGKWIRENLRFPSYPNLRYAPLYADEQPIPDALYDEFAFEYVVPERGHGGLSFVGQDITSSTHHVFYVLHDIADDFAAAIEEQLCAEIEEKCPVQEDAFVHMGEDAEEPAEHDHKTPVVESFPPKKESASDEPVEDEPVEGGDENNG